MTEENNKLNAEKELCKFYRALAAVQIAAVDYVRVKKKKNENDTDYKQRVAEKAKEVTTELRKLMQNPGSSSEAQPIMLSSEVEEKPATLQFLEQTNCQDQTWCWDPVTKTCVPC